VIRASAMSSSCVKGIDFEVTAILRTGQLLKKSTLLPTGFCIEAFKFVSRKDILYRAGIGEQIPIDVTRPAALPLQAGKLSKQFPP
jgi:hypothetical protein